MIAVVGFLVGLGFVLADPISNQASSFQRDVPRYVDDANKSLADLQGWLDRPRLRPQVKREGETALQTIGERITGGAGEVVGFTRDAVQQLVEASIALVLIIVLSVYMLIYGDRIGAVVRAVVPPGDGTPDDDFPTRIQASLFGYVRGQFLFSLIMGTSAGRDAVGARLARHLPRGQDLRRRLRRLVRVRGADPVHRAGDRRAAAGDHRRAVSENPIDAVWLIIAFIVLQQLEGHVVAPNVFGQALRINPLLVIFALLLGGAARGLPRRVHRAADRRDRARDRRLHVHPRALPALGPAGRGAAAAAASEHCPECGVLIARGLDECPACGTELGDHDGAASAAASGPG